ncbi:MAG: hypothetical protein PHV34_14450 [Verrucomicrobiae bacterium]|nr:hypothetical protein [Verrucomicrobiae bacterium]
MVDPGYSIRQISRTVTQIETGNRQRVKEKQKDENKEKQKGRDQKDQDQEEGEETPSDQKPKTGGEVDQLA